MFVTTVYCRIDNKFWTNRILGYHKCPEISNTLLLSIWAKFYFFMHLFLKIPSGMVNSADPDQTLIRVCIVCICHFVNHFGV